MQSETYLVAINKDNKIYANQEWLGTDSKTDKVVTKGLTEDGAVKKVKELRDKTK
jgi:hypothetical protein